MIGPYAFIRLVTIGLGLTWTVFGVVRLVRVATEWKEQLESLRVDVRCWRRWIAIACLRATVLDPLNLALLCLLLALWSLPGVG